MRTFSGALLSLARWLSMISSLPRLASAIIRCAVKGDPSGSAVTGRGILDREYRESAIFVLGQGCPLCKVQYPAHGFGLLVRALEAGNVF